MVTLMGFPRKATVFLTTLALGEGLRVLVRRRHGPRALHPPHGERVAESLVRHVAAAGHLVVHLVALQHLTQEVYVPGGQLQGLDLAELVRGQRGDDFAQRREGLVQGLSPLPLPDVGQDPLVLQLLVGLRAARTGFLGPLQGRRAAPGAVLPAGLLAAVPPLPGEARLVPALQLLLARHQTIHRGDRGAGALFHFSLEEMQGQRGENGVHLRSRGSSRW